MTVASNQPTPIPDHRDTSAGVPSFVLWVAVLMTCLTVAWRDVALTGQSLPARPHALRLVYSAELLTAAALFPTLFLTLPRILLVLATGLLATQAAGHVQHAPVAESLSYAGQFLAYVVALMLWSTRRHRMSLIAFLLMVWLLAPPLLYAIFRDFSPSLLMPQAMVAVSPLLSPAPWLVHTVHVVLALGVVIVSQSLRHRHANG